MSERVESTARGKAALRREQFVRASSKAPGSGLKALAEGAERLALSP